MSDMVATLPRAPLEDRKGSFPLFDPPLALPRFTLSAVWHARVDRDPAHRWLRQRLDQLLGRGADGAGWDGPTARGESSHRP